jgi:hypothetical protein
MTQRQRIIGGITAALVTLALTTACGKKTDPAPDGGNAAGGGTVTKPEGSGDKGTGSQATSGTKSGEMAPIAIPLPKPAFVGTPKNIPPGTNVEKPSGKPRGPFLAPKDVKNVSAGKTVTSSDMEPIIGELELVTDGDKEATDGSYVELGPGTQWLQIDLEAEYELYAIVVWHYHSDPRVYRDIVVQVADDADFITGVKTLFNNDADNSSGLGIGDTDKEFFEVFEGKLVDPKGVKARYVRLYSNGSTADDMNHYTEVEVYGRP